MVITKAMLIEKLAEKLGVTKKEAGEFINGFQELVVDEVVEGNEVKVTGFVSFSSAERSARTMRNPQTGEPIEVAAYRGVTVRPFKAFKDAVKNSGK